MELSGLSWLSWLSWLRSRAAPARARRKRKKVEPTEQCWIVGCGDTRLAHARKGQRLIAWREQHLTWAQCCASYTSDSIIATATMDAADTASRQEQRSAAAQETMESECPHQSPKCILPNANVKRLLTTRTRLGLHSSPSRSVTAAQHGPLTGAAAGLRGAGREWRQRRGGRCKLHIAY